MVDSADVENWKKRLVILNWTVVSAKGQRPPLQADVLRHQSSPFRHSTAQWIPGCTGSLQQEPLGTNCDKRTRLRAT